MRTRIIESAAYIAARNIITRIMKQLPTRWQMSVLRLGGFLFINVISIENQLDIIAIVTRMKQIRDYITKKYFRFQ